MRDCGCVSPLVIGISGVSCSGKTSLAAGLQARLMEKNGTDCTVKVVAQDLFYKSEGIPMDSTSQYPNYEVPEAFAWDDFNNFVHDAKASLTIRCSKCGPLTSKLPPGQEFYVKAKTLEMNGELMEACKWYKKAERAGHNLTDTPTADVSLTAIAIAPPVTKHNFLIIEGILILSEYLDVKFDIKVFTQAPKSVIKDRRMNTAPVPDVYFDSCVWESFVRLNADLLAEKAQDVIRLDSSKAAPIAMVETVVQKIFSFKK
eukprot:TRINITY_DN13060_c0_g1_i1.p1 TRINITY_DN13060_c0_g1~~TRINITY_DN13060_c0_g1_i1.p1  ORF type:complete len:259 (+),score=37.08 TRINITY_DN13060_c0_g1_i1:1-777(+)